MAALPNIILSCSAASFEKVEGQPGVYRKELVYPGHFVKRNDKGEVEFELPVDEALLDHWVASFNKMKASGIEVPVPIEHTTDPEMRRGTVVDLRKEYNPERRSDALYSYIKFRDPEAEKLATTTQVSLFSPPSFTDGKGNKYVRPIRHVALTDYPLIPGLQGFEKAVAASLSSDLGPTVPIVDAEQPGAPEMSQIAELADRLGVVYPPDADDATIMGLIEEAWNADEAEDAQDMTETETETEDDMADMDPLADDGSDVGMGMGEFEVDDEEQQQEQPAAFSNVSPVIISQIARSRRTELEQLTRDRKITPAARDKFIAKYCSTQNVAFACSSGNGSSLGDDYDAVVAALSLNAPSYRTGERSGAQHVPGEKSPLVADAERRAKTNT